MRTVILLAAYVVLCLAAVPLLLICTIFRWKRPIQAYSRFSLRLGRRILGIQLELRGMENFDREKPYIFMPNHLSLLDGPILFLVIPRFVRVILKRSVFKFPIIGQAMRVVDFIPVNRQGRESGIKSIQKAARMIQEKKVPFLIFPEGTRSRSGELQRLRRGGFFLALESNIGDHRSSQWTVVPELEVQVGYLIRPRLRLLTGYSCLCFPGLARASEQIDPVVNTNLWPPVNGPVTGPARPASLARRSDVWIQGVTAGIEYCW